MLKLAVFDMDGTLLNDAHTVSEENLKALELLRNNGVKVVIATGRPEQLLKPFFDILGRDNYYIMYNGSGVKNIEKNDYLLKQIMSKESVREVLRIADKADIINLSYAEEAIFSKPNYRVKFFADSQDGLPQVMQSNFVLNKEIDDIVENYDLFKVLLIENDPEKYERMKTMFTHIEGIDQVRSHFGYLDIVPKNSSKGNAAKAFAEKFNISSDEVIVFGDQDNDMSMFKFAKYSVAMGNAIDDIKNVASFTTLTNNESGVAYAINNFVKDLL